MKKGIKIIILLIGLLLLSGCGGTHKNTTGRKDYDASKIKFNCYYEESNDIKKVQTYSDFVFNTKDNYQAKVYFKVIYIYQDTLSDEKYNDIIKQLDSAECLYGNTCVGDHFKAGVTKFGWDTIVDKKDNIITLTYYKEYGKDVKATAKAISKTKEDYIKSGFKCK